jgi:ribonuclease VapC
VIVVDSSAVVAIMRGEPEAATFTSVLDSATGAIMSAVLLVETTMVMAGRRVGADPQQIASMLVSLGIQTAEVTLEQAGLAVDAFLRYGKGRHRAALNLADCFSYALAKSRHAPLLFKGDDFSRTDIEAAWRP